jgi:hypothetical protein
MFNKIDNLRCERQLSGYPQRFIDLVTNSMGNSHLDKEEKPFGSVYIPYVKHISGKFNHMGNHYHIRIIFKN